MTVGSWECSNLLGFIQLLPSHPDFGTTNVNLYFFANGREGTRELSDDGKRLEATIAGPATSLAYSLHVVSGGKGNHAAKVYEQMAVISDWKLPA